MWYKDKPFLQGFLVNTKLKQLINNQQSLDWWIILIQCNQTYTQIKQSKTKCSEKPKICQDLRNQILQLCGFRKKADNFSKFAIDNNTRISLIVAVMNRIHEYKWRKVG